MSLRLFVPAVALLLSVFTSPAANPFITSIYTADPSAHVWADGRLYLYPSHDMDPAVGSDKMDRYHVFSTDNMVDWRDEGEILRSSQLNWSLPQGGFMWAPDCAYKNGVYYFYFPHPSDTNWNNSWKMGVATSLSPCSGFTPAGYIPGVGGFSMIDPQVFIDDDGQAYLYYGGGGNCAGVKLNPNMTNIDGTVQTMTGLQDFHEATWVFKRNGTYYLTYADNFPGSNRLRYATSPFPLGPWTYKGIYLQPVSSDTSHGSVVQYKGNWYQFYHNAAISGQGNLRSVCVDLLTFDGSGNINTVVQTLTGPPAVGPSPPAATNSIKIEAETGTVTNATIANDANASGGKCIQNLHQANSAVELDNVNGQAGGRTTLDLHFANGQTGFSKLQLIVNGVDWSYVNELPTGGWSTFTGDSHLTIPLGPGSTNVLRFKGGNGGVNLDYITVTPVPLPPWNVQVQNDSNFGVQGNQFGFDIGSVGWSYVVDASTDMVNWLPVNTNTVTGTAYFGDPNWTNYSGRFYRVRSF